MNKYFSVDNETNVAVSGVWGEEVSAFSGETMVEISGDATIGWLWDGTTWSAPTDTRTYAELRAEAYPSLTEQADMAYWDRQNGTTTLDDAIKAVKDAYPKPTA